MHSKQDSLHPILKFSYKYFIVAPKFFSLKIKTNFLIRKRKKINVSGKAIACEPGFLGRPSSAVAFNGESHVQPNFLAV